MHVYILSLFHCFLIFFYLSHFFFFFFFFFNDTATTEIYTLSLHDALPISYVLQNQWPCQVKSRLRYRAGIQQNASNSSMLGDGACLVWRRKEALLRGHYYDPPGSG